MATCTNQLFNKDLQCPICLKIYSDPKLLDCSHTFCSGCITLFLRSQEGTSEFQCPSCHKTTIVPEGDIGCLQTNVVNQTLVRDGNTSQVCTICKTDTQIIALTYCQECDDFMCVDCHKTHDNQDKCPKHQVVEIDDIFSGKVMVTKPPRKCATHSTELVECFCVDCKKYVCSRCGMMEHTVAGHCILDRSEHRESQLMKIRDLSAEANTKRSSVSEFITFVEEQQEAVKVVKERLAHQITDSCEESIRQLQGKRDLLVKKCNDDMDKLDQELQEMKDHSRAQIGQIGDMSELVANVDKVQLEGEFLAAHETLCKELEKVLGKTDPDCDRAKAKTQKAEKMSFPGFQIHVKTELGDESASSLAETKPWRSRHKCALQDDHDIVQEILTEELFRNFTGILNKLTPTHFSTLVEQAKRLPINTEERLKGVTNLLFKKAISEPMYSMVYAVLSQRLSQIKVQSKTNPRNWVQFRQILIPNCQREFERGDEIDEKRERERIAELPTNQRPAAVQELTGKLNRARKRVLGTIRFIGELYLLRILTESIMHDCILKLLKAKDDDALECFCMLMFTIGKILDHSRAKNRIDQYFRKFGEIIASKKNKPRIRFLLCDLIDMRKNNWAPRPPKEWKTEKAGIFTTCGCVKRVKTVAARARSPTDWRSRPDNADCGRDPIPVENGTRAIDSPSWRTKDKKTEDVNGGSRNNRR